MNVNPSEYFAPFAARLDKFAARHNLEVEKYNHGTPLWSFSFMHPLGGYGRVDVSTDGKEVYTLNWWTLDDYDRLNRRMKSTPPHQMIENPETELEGKLLESIKEILKWKIDELKDLGGISRGPWCDPEKRHKFPKVVL